MNKEEIDNLENYLKNDLPKIEPTIPIANFGSVDLDDLMDSIKEFKKVPTSDELLRENKRLRNELEEKDKVISEAIELINNHNKLENELGGTIRFNLVKLSEILTGGKNANSK